MKYTYLKKDHTTLTIALYIFPIFTIFSISVYKANLKDKIMKNHILFCLLNSNFTCLFFREYREILKLKQKYNI